MRGRWIWTLLFLPLLSTGCGKGEEKSVEPDKQQAKVEFPSAKQPIPTTYFTEDHVTAVILHPKRVINSKLAKRFFAVLDQNKPGTAEKFFNDFVDKSGLDLREFEQVVGLLDKDSLGDPSQLLNALPDFGKKRKKAVDGKDEDAKNSPSFILRLGKPVDSKVVIEKLKSQITGDDDKKQSGPAIVSNDYNGKTIHTDPDKKLSFCFVDKTTIIGGSEEMVKKMIDGKPVDTSLTRLLSRIGMEHDFISAAAEGPGFDNAMKAVKSRLPVAMVPEEYRGLVEDFGRAKAIYYTISITSSPLIAFGVTMPDEESAAKLASDINARLLTKLREEYQKKRDDISQGREALDDLIDGIAAGSKGRDVVLSVRRPKSLDEMPDMLAPFLR